MPIYKGVTYNNIKCKVITTISSIDFEKIVQSFINNSNVTEIIEIKFFPNESSDYTAIILYI